MDLIEKINKAKVIWQVLPELTVRDLEKIIKISADSYYNSGISLISDQNYDIIVERLKHLKPDSEILKVVGAPIRGKKIKLPYWMGSMDKIKADDILINKWTKRYTGPYVISDKLDGVSCLLTRSDQKINLYTRGDGSYGQDITHLLNVINMSIDTLTIQKQPEKIAIRGELIMRKDKFVKYSKIMANARNMVSGIVNSKKESVNKEHAKDIDFVAYEVIEPWDKSSNQMKMLKKWGLNVVYYDIYEYISHDIIDGILQKRKKKSKYEIDGIIVTDDKKHPRNTTGNPPYSFAYKGSTPTADVKVLDVLWKPSKDGVLVPRIRYEKVRLSQVDLEYTTGFHAKFIKDNKIGPGAIVRIVRSGDVIPYITEIVKPAKKPSLPKKINYVWSGVNIILSNADKNRMVIIKRLTKFMKNIGVENISEGIVTKMVDAGYDNILKIVSMTKEDFLSLEGFKETLASKLYQNLKKSLNKLDILTLMVATNIFGRGFGKKKIQKILDTFPNIVEEYSSKTHHLWREKLQSVPGFDVTIDIFLYALPNFQKFYNKISKIVTVKPYIKKSKGLFMNQIIVFTGFRNKSWENFIENEGGKISNTVSKGTTLLIYKDGEKTSSKYLKAKQLGIAVISKSDFSRMYGLSI
jgi:NAD-dependent DNA ligase